MIASLRLVALTLSLLITSCALEPSSVTAEQPEQAARQGRAASSEARYVLEGPLRVMTLNLAHGRKDGINQLLLGEQSIRQNLSTVAEAIKQSGADIVALQEADGASRWSGGFDHVAELAHKTGFPVYQRASHAQGWLFDYGTAILSRSGFQETIEHAFEPTPPTMTKGFLLAQVDWRPRPGTNQVVSVDILSVHLDFSRESVRQQQIAEISKVLSKRDNLLIVMGDFNSDWFADDSVVKKLSQRAGLHTYEPTGDNLGTYKSGKQRLDWILISSELAFNRYEVLPDVLSDHSAVVADIVLGP